MATTHEIFVAFREFDNKFLTFIRNDFIGEPTQCEELITEVYPGDTIQWAVYSPGIAPGKGDSTLITILLYGVGAQVGDANPIASYFTSDPNQNSTNGIFSATLNSVFDSELPIEFNYSLYLSSPSFNYMTFPVDPKIKIQPPKAS